MDSKKEYLKARHFEKVFYGNVKNVIFSNPLFLLLRIPYSLIMGRQKWILFFAIINIVTGVDQKFALEPQDQTAILGSRVTLPCRVVNKSGQLQWTKDNFGLGIHRHLSGFEKYRMIGSDDEGDFSLDIKEVSLEDDAEYQCQVSPGPQGEPAIRSKSARLQVLVPPAAPKILQGPSIQVIEDQSVELECVSLGGKPAAEITWVTSDGGVITQGVTNLVEMMADGKRFTTRSILNLRPRSHHHNQTISCQAQNTADRNYKAASITLDVKSAPKVRLFFKNVTPNGRVREGDNLVLGCQASANPNSLIYKWYINNEQIIGNFTNEMHIRNISRTLNDATAKCEVHNSVGKSADTKILDVMYPPSFVSRPQDVESETGLVETLSCLVDGNPKPDILWLHYDEKKVVRVGKSPNLTVEVNEKTSGQYLCKASVHGYHDIEAVATIYMKGPPVMDSNKTQYVVEGESVRIDCVSLSVPKPDFVIWTLGGQEINAFVSDEYVILEEYLNGGLVKSTLVIKKSEAKHFGFYNCTVVNLYGSSSQEIRLIRDKSFPVIPIICAGGSLAILVLIIMFIIMICHRQHRKNMPKELSDVKKEKKDMKDSDRNSNISDLKFELWEVDGGKAINPEDYKLNSHANPGLPLAGPVKLPPGLNEELLKQYQRYSNDFTDPTHIQFKLQTQPNGYIPYVDYSKDYLPPLMTRSLSGSMPRSIDSGSTAAVGNSLNGSLQRLGGVLYGSGPDVIPSTPSQSLCGVDVRYAATYGNPYLRVTGPMTYSSNSSTVTSPPHYYMVKNNGLTQSAVTSSMSSPKPSMTVSSSSSLSSGAQPQVPKSTHSTGALYILPVSSNAGGHSRLNKTKGSATSPGTHV